MTLQGQAATLYLGAWAKSQRHRGLHSGRVASDARNASKSRQAFNRLSLAARGMVARVRVIPSPPRSPSSPPRRRVRVRRTLIHEAEDRPRPARGG